MVCVWVNTGTQDTTFTWSILKCLQSRVPTVPMTPGTRTGLGCRGCGGQHPAEAGRDRGQRPRPEDTECPDRGWASEAEAGRGRGRSSLRATSPGLRPPALLSSPSRIVSRGRWWRPPTLRPSAPACCHSSYLWVNVWTSRSRGHGHCCCSGQARSAPVFVAARSPRLGWGWRRLASWWRVGTRGRGHWGSSVQGRGSPQVPETQGIETWQIVPLKVGSLFSPADIMPTDGCEINNNPSDVREIIEHILKGRYRQKLRTGDGRHKHNEFKLSPQSDGETKEAGTVYFITGITSRQRHLFPFL